MTPEQDHAPRRSAIEQLDRDPASRKRFLKALGGTGAVAAFGVVLAACGSDDSKSSGSGSTTPATSTTKSTSGTDMFGKGDLGILGYALTLEYLETDFYNKAIDSGKLKGTALQVAKDFGAEEAAHVSALEEAIKKAGGKLPAKPKTKFPLEDQKSILELAATVENLGASAYLGQAPLIQDKEVLAAALSIHTVEGRHAAILGAVTGGQVSPDGAFPAPTDAKTVLEKVKPFIAS